MGNACRARAKTLRVHTEHQTIFIAPKTTNTITDKMSNQPDANHPQSNSPTNTGFLYRKQLTELYSLVLQYMITQRYKMTLRAQSLDFVNQKDPTNLPGIQLLFIHNNHNSSSIRGLSEYKDTLENAERSWNGEAVFKNGVQIKIVESVCTYLLCDHEVQHWLTAKLFQSGIGCTMTCIRSNVPTLGSPVQSLLHDRDTVHMICKWLDL